MAVDKPVTVRLPQSQVRELMALAVMDGGNLAEQIRRAVSSYIDGRLSAPDLDERVAAARERHANALDALMRQR